MLFLICQSAIIKVTSGDSMSGDLKSRKEEEKKLVNKLLENQKETMFAMYNDYDKPLEQLSIQKQLVILNFVKNIDKVGTYSEIDFINLTDPKRQHDDLAGLMADYQMRHGLYPFIKLINANEHLVRALIDQYCVVSFQNKNGSDLEKLSPEQRTHVESIGFYFDEQVELTKPKQLELRFEH